jgi:hypothetical protein
MNYRRTFLFTFVLGLVVSAAHRAPAATGAVEATGYGGSSDANWACGPRSQANYGGVGARVSVHPAPPEPPPALAPSLLPSADPAAAVVNVPPEDAPVVPVASEELRRAADDLREQGVAFDVSGAAEYRQFRFQSGGRDNTIPPDGYRATGGARVGWDGRNFGFRVGLSYYPYFNSESSKKLTGIAFPELAIRLGDRQNFAFSLGIGSYDPVLLLHPAVGFMGLQKRLGDGTELHGYLALTAASDAQFSGRVDIRGYVPLTHPNGAGRFDLNLGVAAMVADTVRPEGRLGVRYGF